VTWRVILLSARTSDQSKLLCLCVVGHDHDIWHATQQHRGATGGACPWARACRAFMLTSELWSCSSQCTHVRKVLAGPLAPLRSGRGAPRKERCVAGDTGCYASAYMLQVHPGSHAEVFCCAANITCCLLEAISGRVLHGSEMILLHHRCRIGLSGTVMSNNYNELWCVTSPAPYPMCPDVPACYPPSCQIITTFCRTIMNWASPNCLGAWGDFNKHYVKPMQVLCASVSQALCPSSWTGMERVASLMPGD
jgi:hypothetical protein